ncbi:MAG: hypothetical protein D6679_09765 [Candidatus Hydrogenedentota bacterium]|nr:MAG: hypothetical protein D6679_09765 [Candidatus Hydrogenedentota bacterium]
MGKVRLLEEHDKDPSEKTGFAKAFKKAVGKAESEKRMKTRFRITQRSLHAENGCMANCGQDQL